jgi:hypothetical protein
MMSVMREFDWSYELGMYAGTAAGLVVVFAAGGGLVWLAELLLRGGWRHRSNRL